MQFLVDLTTSAAKLVSGRPASSSTASPPPSRPSTQVIREIAATSAPVFF